MPDWARHLPAGPSHARAPILDRCTRHVPFPPLLLWGFSFTFYFFFYTPFTSLCVELTFCSPFFQDILVGVNSQVAEKERKLRLIEIYNKIDAKSATTYRSKKFKKSDLLSGNRRLM